MTIISKPKTKKRKKITISDIMEIYEQLIIKLRDEPEQAIKYLDSKWKQLTYVGHEILREFIERHHKEVMEDVKASLLTKMCVTQIKILTEIDFEDEVESSLSKTNKLRDVQVAKLFYGLSKNGYINNKLPEIAAAVAHLFQFNYGTIFSYYNTPSKMSKAKPLLLDYKS
jgi:hypothetical protein